MRWPLDTLLCVTGWIISFLRKSATINQTSGICFQSCIYRKRLAGSGRLICYQKNKKTSRQSLWAPLSLPASLNSLQGQQSKNGWRVVKKSCKALCWLAQTLWLWRQCLCSIAPVSFSSISPHCAERLIQSHTAAFLTHANTEWISFAGCWSGRPRRNNVALETDGKTNEEKEDLKCVESK